MNRPWGPTIVVRSSALIVAFAFGAASCGTAELEIEATFDGAWSVTELAADGDSIDLVGQPIEIEIDTGQAAVRGRTTCQQLFGSYTLDGMDEGAPAASSGDASFTIPSPEASADCEAADRLVHLGLVEALESVTQWRREGPTLTLSSPSGSLLVLEGQTRGE